MDREPLVSIITVCFNSERYLKNTIESILNQTYANIQYIIVDGNSTDNTLNIIKEYENRFDGRMLWISEPDNGIYDAMNKGINLSHGEIIGILNSDDFYIDKFVIEKVVNKIIEDSALCLYADLLFVDQDNTDVVVRKWVAKKGSFLLGWNPPHPTTFIKNQVYKQYGLYKTEYRIASDYDILYRILHKGKVRVSYLHEYTVKMRVGGRSTSGISSTIAGNKEILNTLRENNEKFPMFIIILRLLVKIKQLINI